MNKQPNPELIDEDNPEWSEADFSRARPANEVLQEVFPRELADQMLKPRGRPKAEVTKERITIRLSPEVVNAFRATGDGWQTRMDRALKDWLKTHSPA
ncbi:MAG: BrnA antitoxin family protein [Methyloprofundus sp.]|nr:BrnA antitoxin family protein [Methyloprofundus sp.]